MPHGQHYPPKGYRDNSQHHNSDSHHDEGQSRNSESARRTSKQNDGQHRSPSYYTPGMESGMKSSISTPARVGHESGGETNMSVPKPARDSMINTTTGSAGPRVPGEITSGDDK